MSNKDIEKYFDTEKIPLQDIIRLFKREGIENFVIVKREKFENVLSELEKKDKQIKLEIKGRDILVNLNTELSKELETYKEEFKKINKALNLEEGIVEPYTVDIIEGLKRCVTQQHAELEKWEKIAEKLAGELEKCTAENKEWYLDWAKSEVLKNE